MTFSMWAGGGFTHTGHKLLIPPTYKTLKLANKQSQSYYDFSDVGREGFEPPKAEPTGLQPVPFDRSGTYPKYLFNIV